MKENMKDTIRIDAKNVDREVGEAFKSYVLKKHGKIRGVFSDEVTKALATYLRDVKKSKENKKAQEKEERNIASWGRIGSVNNERVYLAVEEKLVDDGVAFRKNRKGDIGLVNLNANEVKAAIRTFLRADKYFDMLCQRHSLLVLDDDSVIETSTLKE